jgi:hypothetical protein
MYYFNSDKQTHTHTHTFVIINRMDATKKQQNYTIDKLKHQKYDRPLFYYENYTLEHSTRTKIYNIYNNIIEIIL